MAATALLVCSVENTRWPVREAWIAPTDGSGGLYYPKGSLAGLLIDIMIRDASDNQRSLETFLTNQQLVTMTGVSDGTGACTMAHAPPAIAYGSSASCPSLSARSATIHTNSGAG